MRVLAPRLHSRPTARVAPTAALVPDTPAVQPWRRKAATGKLATGAASAAASMAGQQTQQAGGAAPLDAQDVGGIVHMEHINLEVPDLELARLFYAEGLGLTADPGTRAGQRGGLGVVWYNIGRQQFHICEGAAPQNTGGVISLAMPQQLLEAAAAQLAALQPAMSGTRFAYEHADGSRLHVTDPWGQRFELSIADAGLAEPRGIASACVPCHTGTAAAIARFYQRVFGARTSTSSGQCAIHMGPGTRVVFQEDASLGPLSSGAALAAFTGWHFALYCANFGAAFKEVESLGLIHNDHPFSDKVLHGWPDALRHRQFRLQDIVAVEEMECEGGGKLCAGQVLVRVQHEVRSCYHPRFLRPLYNRGGPNFDVW